jgi:NAD(P)-dependent dehydrogenase (short-subunit alcohol dehydrogenase family)
MKKTIIITGASSGIGEQAALLFASRGWQVAAIVRNPEKLQMFAGSDNIRTYRLDVTDRDAIAPCFERIIADHGRVDAIVNNAGVYTTDPLETTPDGMIDSIIDTNIKGVVRATRAIIPHFRERGGGVIVNIASIAGRVTTPFQSVYHASKWAVEGFSESLCYELAPLGIRMKVVEPGVVKTPLYRSMGEAPFGDYPEEYRKAFAGWWKFIRKGYHNGYPASRDAATIWRAVNSGDSKLRYTTDFQTRAVICLRRLLPPGIFRWVMRKSTGI